MMYTFLETTSLMVLFVTNFFFGIFLFHILFNFDYIPSPIPVVLTEVEELNKPAIVAFENKYKTLYYLKLKKDAKSVIPDKTSYVMEYCLNYGNVIMKYDYESNAFQYFADKSVPYNYLETVARKFVIYNQCLHLYNDMDSELKRVQEEQKEKEKEQEQKQEQKQEVKKSVFAQLKKNKQPSSDKRTIIVKTNTNIFVYRGKLNNFQILPSTIPPKRKTITFADFKKINTI
jgi:hypothetical protein